MRVSNLEYVIEVDKEEKVIYTLVLSVRTLFCLILIGGIVYGYLLRLLFS